MESQGVGYAENISKAMGRSYAAVRARTEELCAPLETEDYVIQSMPDVSPPKWHIGHVTWFFETFLLGRFLPDYTPYHPGYAFLFNSYYESIGDRWARANRGLLSRPTVQEVYRYRACVDEKMQELIAQYEAKAWPDVPFLLDLGLHHEQQHQELLVTDFKNILALNPLRPRYAERNSRAPGEATTAATFIDIEGGMVEIGHSGSGFSFDNERPRHRVWLKDYRLQNRPVTNGEYLEFMEAGGYSDFRHWLSDGWARVKQDGWNSPLYWENRDGQWFHYTLAGMRTVDPSEPVTHVSYYEADAFARWANKRLPTESEWEHAARRVADSTGNFADSGEFHPMPARPAAKDLTQMFGDVWEWTCSAYLPYPGFKPEPGAVGEYNGKFMSDQMILRGGSCATPANHIRPTYRNFFQCDKRWQFTGIRLAEDAGD